MIDWSPADVRQDLATPGNTAPLPRLLRTQGVRPLSPTSTLGDPTQAAAHHGEDVLDRWTTHLENTVLAPTNSPRPRN